MATYHVIKRGRFDSGLSTMAFISVQWGPSVEIGKTSKGYPIWGSSATYEVANAELMEQVLNDAMEGPYNEVIAWTRIDAPEPAPEADGIDFALDNIQAGQAAGWTAGTAADALPHPDRAAFLAGVRVVEELDFQQQQAARRLLHGGAHAGDAMQLPPAIVASIRARNRTLDYVLACVAGGTARLHLPPYED